MFMTLLMIVLQVTFGLLYGNMIEWVLHKYVLHEIGKKKSSMFSFHWHEHHKKSRKFNFYDDDYEKKIWNWNARGKEALGLLLMWLAHSWLFFFFPIFAITLTYCVINYYFTHKWSHQNPMWAKKHLRWHWDHHQGKNQDANYCVTQPWFDYIMGTRIYYRESLENIGTTNNNIAFIKNEEIKKKDLDNINKHKKTPLAIRMIAVKPSNIKDAIFG